MIIGYSGFTIVVYIACFFWYPEVVEESEFKGVKWSGSPLWMKIVLALRTPADLILIGYPIYVFSQWCRNFQLAFGFAFTFDLSLTIDVLQMLIFVVRMLENVNSIQKQVRIIKKVRKHVEEVTNGKDDTLPQPPTIGRSESSV